MREFNLIDEPWIPVVTCGGERVEVGIRSVLRDARTIERIEHDSPLVVVSLYRLLLAVLYRALRGPSDFDASLELLEHGLPASKIDAYLNQWHDRFFLFDDRFPFLQVSEFQPKEWRSWTVLAAEHNPDNAKVLSNHTNVHAAGEIDPGAAARWICATQTFSVSAGKSELSHTGGAPSAGGLLVTPLGETLEESLIFALVPQNTRISAGDEPAWERAAESVRALREGPEREPSGFADAYSWRTRTVHCRREVTGRVAKVAFASGVKPKQGTWIDPMVPYKTHETYGRLPLKLRNRGLWRDFDSLLPDPLGVLAPQVVEHAVRIARDAGSRAPRSFAVFGLGNEKAKLERWYSAQFHWPQSLIAKPGFRASIRSLLDRAEAGGKGLHLSAREFGRQLLSRGDRKPLESDVSRFAETVPSESLFWAAMEDQFRRTLAELEAGGPWDEVSSRWIEEVATTARESWQSFASQTRSDAAWSMRALLMGERVLNRELGRLKSGS